MNRLVDERKLRNRGPDEDALGFNLVTYSYPGCPSVFSLVPPDVKSFVSGPLGSQRTLRKSLVLFSLYKKYYDDSTMNEKYSETVK